MSAMDGMTAEDLIESGTRPTTYSLYVAILAVAVATVAVAPAMAASLPVVLTGAVVLGVGARHGNRTWVGRGYLVMVAGGFVHGAIGGSVVGTLAAVVAATVAWDVAENGIGIAEQLGSEASAKRAELVHAVAVTAVGTLAGGAAFLVAFVFANNQPMPALVLLLFALVLAVASVRQG
jgi:hypothetical protein